MSNVSNLSLIDLAVVVLVVLSVAGALRGRRGVLAAVGAAIGTAVGCWLVLAAVLVWGPAPWQDLVRHSELVRLLPPPAVAVDQARHLVSSWLTR